MKQIRESHSQSLAQSWSKYTGGWRFASQSGRRFNEALPAQKLTEIAPLEAKLQGERLRVHQEMLSVLTPDQKAKLEQQREQFKSKWAERGVNKKKSN
jgi:Spy/CpxP family protein refolding chaperone